MLEPAIASIPSLRAPHAVGCNACFHVVGSASIGLRTFPRSVARAKSIQPEEFRRPGYPFCAEGEREREREKRTRSCEHKGWRETMGNRERGEDRKREWARRPPLRAREEDGDAGSAPTRHELASTTFVPFSAPTDGVVVEEREEAWGASRRSTRRSRIPEEIPDPVNIAVAREVMGSGIIVLAWGKYIGCLFALHRSLKERWWRGVEGSLWAIINILLYSDTD